MTLVELMVALAIGLATTLAVTNLLITGENWPARTTTSTNDAEQTGAYATYALDKVVRGAGSAIAQSAFPPDRGVLGCTLNAAAILPRTTPFPAPFAMAFFPAPPRPERGAAAHFAQNQSDAGSDVLVVMGVIRRGRRGLAPDHQRQITGAGSSTTTLWITPWDLPITMLHWSVKVVCGGLPARREVATITAPTLNVGGTTYYTANGTTTNLATLTASTSTYVTPIGNAVSNNIQFMLFGVGANRTLYSYDLLQNLQLVGGFGRRCGAGDRGRRRATPTPFTASTPPEPACSVPGPDWAMRAGTSTPSWPVPQK